MLCLGLCVLVYVATLVANANTRYRHSWLPYKTPVDQVNPGDRPSGSPNDYTSDGLVWQDDYDRASWASGAWYHINLPTDVTPHEITLEEHNYRMEFMREGTSLCMDAVLNGDQLESLGPQIRGYFASRIARYQAVEGLRTGGFWDRLKYRETIDAMMMEENPLTYYQHKKEAERSSWSNLIYAPVLGGFVLLVAAGYIYKYGSASAQALRDAKDRHCFSKLFSVYTHGRLVRQSVLKVDGPIRLKFPTMYIADTPYNLRGSYLDENDHTLLTLKNGTQIQLYVGSTTYTRHEDPAVPKKPKFTWDYVEPRKPEPKPLRLRRSIFEE